MAYCSIEVCDASFLNNEHGASKANVPFRTTGFRTQKFGRDVCFANGSAGLEAISLLGDGPLIKSSRNNTCYNDALNLVTNCTIIDGNAESTPTMMTHVLTSPDNLTT
jgi:hypothetical protein